MFAEGESEIDIKIDQSGESLRNRYEIIRPAVKKAVARGLSTPGAKPSDTKILRRGAFFAAEEEHKNSLIDPLTQLYNNKGLEDRLRLEVARLKRAKVGGIESQSWIVIIDGNGLKKINDTKGHAAGNEYLKKIGIGLTPKRGTDTAARQGGDEFAVILSGTDAEGVNIWWQTTLQNLQELGVSISAGAAPIDPENPSQSVHLADLRSYASKREYRTDGQIHLSTTGDLEQIEQLKASDPKIDDRV